MVLCLEDRLVDHVELFIMDLDALVQLRDLLLDDQVFLLALLQLQLIDELLVLLQLLEVGVDALQVALELGAVEQLYPLPPGAHLLVPVIKLVHVVDLVEIADIVAHLPKEAHLGLPEPVPPALLQLQLDVDRPLEVEEDLHQLVHLSVRLPLLNIVHRPSVLDLDEGARLHGEGCELPSVFAYRGDFADIFFCLFLAVEQQKATNERMRKKRWLRLLFFFGCLLLEELSDIALPIEGVHAHVVRVELEFSLHDVVEHDRLLGVHAERALRFDRRNPIPKLALFHSPHSSELLLLLVGHHGLPDYRYFLEELGEYPLQFCPVELPEEGLGLRVELVEPESDVEVVVLEEAHDLLEVLEVLAVDVDVLAYDLAPLAQLLGGLLSVREGALPVSLRLGLEVGKAVYAQEAVFLTLLVPAGCGVPDNLLDD